MRITHLAATLAALWVPFASAGHPAQGMWEGQMELLAEGRESVEAHTVSKVQIVIDKYGKIEGTLPGTGCRLLGIVALEEHQLEHAAGLTVSGCDESGLNGRFSPVRWIGQVDGGVTLRVETNRYDPASWANTKTLLGLMGNLTRLPQ